MRAASVCHSAGVRRSAWGGAGLDGVLFVALHAVPFAGARLGLWLTSLWVLDAFLTERAVCRPASSDDQRELEPEAAP